MSILYYCILQGMEPNSPELIQLIEGFTQARTIGESPARLLTGAAQKKRPDLIIKNRDVQQN